MATAVALHAAGMIDAVLVLVARHSYAYTACSAGTLGGGDAEVAWRRAGTTYRNPARVVALLRCTYRAMRARISIRMTLIADICRTWPASDGAHQQGQRQSAWVGALIPGSQTPNRYGYDRSFHGFTRAQYPQTVGFLSRVPHTCPIFTRIPAGPTCYHGENERRRPIRRRFPQVRSGQLKVTIRPASGITSDRPQSRM
jgi:hypothetical protein